MKTDRYFMTPGDTYIISSDFHNIDIGLIFLHNERHWQKFLPILFNNRHFDNTLDSILKSKINTCIVYRTLDFIESTGLMIVYERKKSPSFLKKYCANTPPFTHLNIDFEKIDLIGNSKDFSKIVIGGGTSFPEDKMSFDKYNIDLVYLNQDTKSDLTILLKTTT